MKLILALLTVLLGSNQIFACSCGERPICGDYSEAKSVFLGKLLKSRKSVVDDDRVNVATFSVGRIFKGVPEKVQDVRFIDGECDPTMKVGEVYLVFQDKREIPLPCNRSGIAAQIPFIMNYVESVDPRDPKFVVTGSFEGLPEEELAKIEVTVSFDGGKVTQNVDRNGNYRIDVKNAGKLRVEARFPFPIDMYYIPDFIELLNMSAVFPGSTPRLLTYEVEFKPNECNFRQFGIKRQKNAVFMDVEPTLRAFGTDMFQASGVVASSFQPLDGREQVVPGETLSPTRNASGQHFSGQASWGINRLSSGMPCS